MKRTALFLVFLFTIVRPVQCQVATGDSLALVDLYNATNGPNWFINTNWLSGPVSSWWGITLSPTGHYVQEIHLGWNNLTEQLPASIGDFDSILVLVLQGNNLAGQIPPEVGNLTSLLALDLAYSGLSGTIPWDNAFLPNLHTLYLLYNQFEGNLPGCIANGSICHLDMQHNKFSSIPDLSSQLIAWYNLYINDNRLDFASIEPNIIFFYGPGSWHYAPQDSVLETIDTTVIQGSSLTLNSKVGGTANLYLWNKNGLPIWGAIDSNFTLSNIAFADSGSYGCSINNSIVPGLTLYRRKIRLHVVDSATGILPRGKDQDLRLHWNESERLLTLEMYSFIGRQATISLLIHGAVR